MGTSEIMKPILWFAYNLRKARIPSNGKILIYGGLCGSRYVRYWGSDSSSISQDKISQKHDPPSRESRVQNNYLFTQLRERMYDLWNVGKTKYSQETYNMVMDMFDCLPLCGVVDHRYYCVHAGISPDLNSFSTVFPLIRSFAGN